MKKFDVKNVAKVAKAAKAFANRYSGEILTGLSIAGGVLTVISAIKDTLKAIELIEEEKKRQNVNALKKHEVVKVAWKCYIPTMITGAVSIGCAVGSNTVHTKRNAALAAAYHLSETALTEYKDKVVESVGEVKEKEISDAIAKDHIEKEPIANNEVIITGNGKSLFFDMISGRYFESDMMTIREAVVNMNERMISEMYISLNEFYYEIGLRPTQLGNELGWNLSSGKIELRPSAQISDDGRPCIALDYCVGPRYDFGELH